MYTKDLDSHEDFSPPPECAVFTPTEVEFQDPLAYIAKIRPEASKTGICKIRPPPDWQPPFAAPVDTFKFIPRIQRLNELEARSRVKLHFLDKLFKFWEFQGTTLKIPQVGRKLLDMQALYKSVEEEGGVEHITRERKWPQIACKLGLPTHKGQGSVIRTHYERLLNPFCLFQHGKSVPNESKLRSQSVKSSTDCKSDAVLKLDKRKSKRLDTDDVLVDYSANSELKKLQFFGAGPKAAVPANPRDEDEDDPQCTDDEQLAMKTRITMLSPGVYSSEDVLSLRNQMLSTADKYHCNVCARGDGEEAMLLCDGCDDAFHIYCLIPPLPDVPKGDWRCPSCLKQACSKPVELYGFEQSKNEYSLQSFGEMADHFKSTYFNMPVQRVTSKMVENEFWRLVSSLEEDVCVLYGADIHAMEMGSGFPTKPSQNLLPEDEEYVHSGWNLNNLPILEQSVLCHINADISGMKIYRTDQQAGEFVVTFPRAYHAGFNNGYNFAEAVNFCPADWLCICRCHQLHTGRACIEHYRSLSRQCVFSHEELICKMAADPDSLDLVLAAATHLDMLEIVEVEKRLRKQLLDRGTVEAEREAFELLPDDERQCSVCKTTCFLSSVTCPCSSDRLVCLHHVDKLCHCPAARHCLRYRYTLDELPSMLHRLKMRAESFDKWNTDVSNALEATGSNKAELWEFKDLLTEAEEKRFPESKLRNVLATAVTEAEKCANVANQLVSKKVHTRHRQSLDGKYVAKLTFVELNSFYEQVASLPCRIPEIVLVKNLVEKVVTFREEAQIALNADVPNSMQLENLIDIGITLDVDLAEIPQLKQVLQQARWLDDMYGTLKNPEAVTAGVMCKLIESGVLLAPHPALESAMAHLQELLTVTERWDEKARLCLQARPRHLKSTMETIINESTSIPAYLPNVIALEEAVRRASEWIAKVESVQVGEAYPYLDVLEGLLNRGRPIPVRLEQLPQLESQVSAAKSWRDRTARTFLKKSSPCTLLEVLSPKTDIGVYSSGGKKKRKMLREMSQNGKGGDCNQSAEARHDDEVHDPATIVASFKTLEQKEVDMMRDLRARNMEGSDGDNHFCVCRKGAQGYMLQCVLCREWFHGTCVPLPKSTSVKSKAGQWSHLLSSGEVKFLCPVCHQSRRPRLETILSLLVSLQKLPVRLAEGEALQCLTERAMAWQDRARTMLMMPELSAALTTFSIVSQRHQEQMAREKTEKIISAELRKAASNPELQYHLASVTHPALKHDPNGCSTALNSLPYAAVTEADILPAGIKTGQDLQNNQSVMEDIGAEVDIPVVQSLGMSSEHAYSSMSKVPAGGSPRKHPRKSPLMARQVSEWPVLEMSDTLRVQLEELMMEGDLLEVTLDETSHIWKLLQACHSLTDSGLHDIQDSDSASGPSNRPREKKPLKLKCLKEMAGLKVKKKKKKLLTCGKVKREQQSTSSSLEGVAVVGTNVNTLPSGVDGACTAKKIKLEPAQRDKSLKSRIRRGGGLQLNFHNARQGRCAPNSRVDLLLADKLKRKKYAMKMKSEFRKEECDRKKRMMKLKMMSKYSEDDIDDDCSADRCLRPIGDAVNWVQCDKCELWFHLLCVGLCKDELKEEEDYVCESCSCFPSASSASSPATIKTELIDDGSILYAGHSSVSAAGNCFAQGRGDGNGSLSGNGQGGDDVGGVPCDLHTDAQRSADGPGMSMATVRGEPVIDCNREEGVSAVPIGSEDAVRCCVLRDMCSVVVGEKCLEVNGLPTTECDRKMNDMKKVNIDVEQVRMDGSSLVSLFPDLAVPDCDVGVSQPIISVTGSMKLS